MSVFDQDDNAKVNKGNYVFISYSSKNQQMADSVRLLLKENNIPCWMAPDDIPAGSKYAHVINDALEKCSCLLLLLTDASQKSQFVEREVERAITYKKPILPMQLEDLELNSGFKFYIGASQIIVVPEIRADAPEFRRVLAGIKNFLGCKDGETIEQAKVRCRTEKKKTGQVTVSSPVEELSDPSEGLAVEIARAAQESLRTGEPYEEILKRTSPRYREWSRAFDPVVIDCKYDLGLDLDEG